MQSTFSPTRDNGEHSVPFMEWAEFVDALPWVQGEHVTLCAPTGWGKTTLGESLLAKREYNIILGTKPEDSTLEEFADANDYRIFKRWPVPSIYKRVVIWPDVRKADKVTVQRPVFASVLNDVYRRGRYCVFVDELDYVCNFLKLSPLVELLWRQGRSLKASVLGGTQRPFSIPLLAYDQATHLFVGWDNDEVNLKRYAGFAGGGKPFQRWLAEHLSSLEEFHFIYLPRKGRKEGMVETKVEL